MKPERGRPRGRFMAAPIAPLPAESYRRSPWGAAISLIAALVYGVSPVDLIPDIVLLLGWADDAVVIPLLIALAWSLWRKRRRARA